MALTLQSRRHSESDGYYGHKLSAIEVEPGTVELGIGFERILIIHPYYFT